MKKASIVVDSAYAQNKIFTKGDHPLNRDNCLEFFHLLQDELRLHGIDLATSDINLPKESCLVFYNDVPKNMPLDKIAGKRVLFLFESEVIKPWNWDIKNHDQFDLVFTWHDEFVDNRKYFKFNFTHSGQVPFQRFEDKHHFACIVSGNKTVHHPLELYSQRLLVIRWFEKNKPKEFDLYGMGWGMFTFSGILRPLNRIPFFRMMLADKYPSYRGPIHDKLTTISKYKFSICFENARGIPGYITEKIFDIMAAGTVPVYWGAPNVADYIPPDCFIDYRNFRSIDELYQFLSEISQEAYLEYQKAIKKYLLSDSHKWFSNKHLSEIIVKNLLNQWRVI